MPRESFPPEVASALGWYVYRLVDPRNGETFYVGKGKGSRVFAHAKGIIENEKNPVSDPKEQRINEIRAAGLDVSHVIHRHGMTSDRVAYEVEAALIDAYPGLTNIQAGHESQDHGCRHAEEICAEFEAVPFTATEPLILISLGNVWRERGIDGAAKGAWRINIRRARRYKLVLAHVRGIVKAAYRPTEWRAWSAQDYPERAGKISFEGDQAEQEILDRYSGKRVPADFRGRNPVRYLVPGK